MLRHLSTTLPHLDIVYDHAALLRVRWPCWAPGVVLCLDKGTLSIGIRVGPRTVGKVAACTADSDVEDQIEVCGKK